MSLFKKRQSKSASAAETSGERRQLTVLFYDIVGSTSLVEDNDPETLRGELDLIHAAARDVIAELGGALVQVMGDGGMAYFGYPVANEDAALSAVTAAFTLLEAREEMNSAPNIRIGIATSVVVLPNQTDDLGAGRLGAVGVAPNLAARLESAAQVNEILVSPSTYFLTHRAVEFSPREGLSLKGFPDVTSAWRPLALRSIASRFERDRDSSGKFTGRQTEVSTLKSAWARAETGSCTSILIEGEPGIGKSRMVAELAGAIVGGRVALIQCQPNTEGDALFGFMAMYDRVYDDGTDENFSDTALRTAERLGALEEDETLSATARREAITTAVVDELIELAKDKPLLIIAEDLHWADEVTLAVLTRLSRLASQSPILVVGTSRPYERVGASLGLEELRLAFRPLPLAPISKSDADSLIKQASRTPLTPVTRDWIVARADGNPLFLTELTAFAGETIANGGQLSNIEGANVNSLNDLLSTRLQSAGAAKRTAQIASVIGREFPYELLSLLISSYNTQELDADLQRLVDHGLDDILGNGHSYIFRHALVRDVAYESQLRSVRKTLHGKIVDLVDSNVSLIDSVPEVLLAEHCLAAERFGRGAELLLNVAEDAIRRSALTAPYDTLQRVLLLSEKIAEGVQRDLIQLKAIILLGPLVTLLEGQRAAEPLYVRGQKLYFVLPEVDRAQYFPILWGWWFTAGTLAEQTRRSEILIRDVKPQADPESRLQALHCGWATLFDGGAHDRCLANITDGLNLYDPDKGQRSRYLYGHDAKVCGLGERALSGWLTGQLELSAEAILECEAWANDTAHLSSQLHGLDIAMQVAVFRHDLLEIDRILTKMATLSNVDAAPAINAKRQIFRGWMAARNGDTGQVAAVMEGLSSLRDLGVIEDLPFYADIAADVTAASRTIDAALGPLDDAIVEARNTGLTYWLPELLRRKAMLTGGAEASSLLDEGFDVSQQQNAQMLALRNMASRLDLGLSLPSDQIAIMLKNSDRVSKCAVREKVLNALA